MQGNGKNKKYLVGRFNSGYLFNRQLFRISLVVKIDWDNIPVFFLHSFVKNLTPIPGVGFRTLAN